MIIINKKIIYIPLAIIIVVGLLYIWASSQFIRVGDSPITSVNDSPSIGDSPTYKNISSCPSEARTIIDKYSINEKQIEGCQSKSFRLNEKDVTFVHIEYGRPNDCPSGCFFSHYCAIVEDGIDYPYVSYFTNPDENILNSEFDDLSDIDTSIMTGRTHQLANDQEFNDFLTNERETNGVFRVCKYYPEKQ